jgi:hypothetical protein
VDEQQGGPVMLVATEALRPPKLRIGRLGNNITLPRTVPAVTLFAGGLGALLTMGLFTIFVGWSTASVAYSATIGAIIGVALVTYSPLRGESLLRWFGLKIQSSRHRSRYMDGVQVRLAVGICYIPTPYQGAVRMRPGAVPVRPGLFDERGTRKRESRRVLPSWFVEQVHAANPDPFATVRPSGPNLSPGSRLKAYRAAAAEYSIPENYVPPTYSAARRFGRWEQNRSLLQSMYASTSQPLTVSDEGVDSMHGSKPGSQPD